jgi:hypothetical protein
VATAALNSRNEAELQQHLDKLGRVGVEAQTGQVLRLLGASLPAWELPALALQQLEQTAGFTSRSAEAMHRIVSLADSPEEGGHRFNELVQVAIEQFNEGSLARAAIMLGLAERLTRRKGLHPDVTSAIRNRSLAALDEKQLKRFAETKNDHALLLQVMNFFPTLTADGLLDQLRNEKKRERRWLLLTLLELHGNSTRSAAMQELEEFLSGRKTEDHGYHTRNLIHLLRRTPVPEGGPGAKELALLRDLSGLDNQWIVIREALRALGQLGHPAAEQILTERLAQLETVALKEGTSKDAQELRDLLDYAASALAAQGTSSAYRVVAQHALRGDEPLGDTAARLEELGKRNLAGAPDLVNLLVRSVKEQLPKKILGVVLQKRESLCHLIRALAGTPLPAVKAVLEEIVRRYPHREIGTEAAKALENLQAKARREEQDLPGMTGDVELFGLPSLLQTLADSQVTGTLKLQNDRGKPCGAVRFQGGKIRSCDYRNLKGEDAIYQLFEKPGPRTFAFRGEAAGAGAAPPAGDLIDVVPTILEAVRRHDEYQQARALVPDAVRFRATDTKPTRLPDEKDVELTKQVWKTAFGGATPEQCEDSVPADAYRVRRLLAHWVEGGALQLLRAA